LVYVRLSSRTQENPGKAGGLSWRYRVSVERLTYLSAHRLNSYGTRFKQCEETPVCCAAPDPAHTAGAIFVRVAPDPAHRSTAGLQRPTGRGSQKNLSARLLPVS